MKTKFLITFLAIAALLISCDDDDDSNEGMLTININNLMTSAGDEQYEGWLIVDGTPVSTGVFTVDDMGTLSQTSFDVDKTDLDGATDFVLSIEPKPDSDPLPSAIKILGGTFSGDMASVSASHSAALGTTFASATGKYILATPTTTTTDDELSGVWFLDLSGGSPAVGLNLPGLPSGWVYEGWVVIDGTPVTTGTFTSVDMEDNSAPYSGSDASGPAFPGEDLVMNAPSGLSFPTDLSEATIVISIEPSPDNDSSPFLFKPLKGSVPGMAEDHVTYDLDNMASGFPSGTVQK